MTYPPPYAPMQQDPPKKKKRKWPWIVGGIVALIVVASVANGGSDKSAQTAPTTTAPAAPATQAAAQPPAPPKPAEFDDGTHRVPEDVKPGTYKTEGPDGPMGVCYWGRLKDTTGSLDAIIASDLPTGPSTVTVAATDKAFKTSGCKPWVLVG